MTRSVGPSTVLADMVHADKHRAPGETYREAGSRIANALSDNEEHFHKLREIIFDQRYMFGGRIQRAVGSLNNLTPYNCFVSGTIEDSFTEGNGSIMHRATEAARTMRMGGGIGYDFSTLRPRGALIRKLGSASSGPVPFMRIFDSVCRATASAGNRRGAQMGVMRVDHPDIEEFIRAKQNSTELTGFNISIACTDEFMSAVERGTDFTLRWGGAAHRSIAARNLWEMIMRSTYDWAEPGILFIDRINEMNNLWYCETIAATNPCGEQPLPPYGACLLGSFNVTKYVRRESPKSKWEFDYRAFFYDIHTVVRAMDNVIDRANYPLHEQEEEARNKRRMGIGVTGMANAIEALGHPYGSSSYINHQGAILAGLRNEAYRVSAMLAKEKGPFPLFDRTKYLSSKFIDTLPEDVIDLIEQFGIRNSHLLSIAPTGTISLTVDNVSSGIEPVFAYNVSRTINTPKGQETFEIEDYGVSHFGVRGKTAVECTTEDHLAVLLNAQRYVDSAVSKTCNVPHDYPWERFKDIYMKAWKGGAKGCTTYRAGGMREAVLVAKPEESEELVCRIDSETGRRECE